MRIRKITLSLALAVGMLLSVFAATSPALAAPAAGSAVSTTEAATADDVQAAACYYRVTSGPVNVRTDPYTTATSVGHAQQGAILTSYSCGWGHYGSYSSCGGGDTWQVITYGGVSRWVAKRCITQI